MLERASRGAKDRLPWAAAEEKRAIASDQPSLLRAVASDRPIRLNLFALPGQTSLLFATITVVIGIPLIWSGSSNSFLLLPVLPIGVGLLTLWDFLRYPDVEQRRWQMKPLPRAQQWLAEWTAQLAAEIGLKRPPVLLVAQQGLGAPFAFGTWRRHYLAFPEWLVQEMETVLHRPHADDAIAVEAILRHELSHFANSDVWLTLLARSLLKATVLFLLANWFALIWLPFLYELMRQEVMDWTAFVPSLVLGMLPPQMEDFIRHPPALSAADILVMELIVSASLWPLIAGALILWRYTWNRLLQVRELYCDARVASWLKSPQAVERAIVWFAAVSMTTSSVSPPSLWKKLRVRLGLLPRPHPLAWPDPAFWRRWLSPQPQYRVRRATLAHPERVHGTPAQIGRRAGIAVLLFYLINASVFGPTRRGMDSSTAAGFGFIVLALGLTPLVVVEGPNWQGILRRIAQATTFYTLIFGVSLATLMAIATLGIVVQPDMLDLVMYALAFQVPGHNLLPVVDNPVAWIEQAVIGAAATFLVGLPLLLFCSLAVDAALKRRILTWYPALSLSHKPKLFRAYPKSPLSVPAPGGLLAPRPALSEAEVTGLGAFFGQVLILITTAVVALILWLGAVPLLNLIAFPAIFDLDVAFGVQISLALVLAVLAGGAFLMMNRRYARRCPECKATIGGAYFLGKCCPRCGLRLNPWLIADY